MPALTSISVPEEATGIFDQPPALTGQLEALKKLTTYN